MLFNLVPLVNPYSSHFLGFHKEKAQFSLVDLDEITFANQKSGQLVMEYFRIKV